MDLFLSEFDSKLKKPLEHLKEGLTSIRTSTAQSSLLENIQIDAYDTKMPLVELASITTPDRRLIVVQPWDMTLIGKIEKAIRDEALNLNPIVEGNFIRVPIPPLTEERRKEFIKLASIKVEEAKVSVRNIRHEALRKIETAKENNEIGEDEEFRLKKRVQEVVDNITETIVEMGKKKEEELLRV